MTIAQSDYEVDATTLSDHLKSIEFLCRHSSEYRLYLQHLYECFEYITSPDFLDLKVDSDDVTMEMHHIITLYDLANIVGTKMIAEQAPGTSAPLLTDFDIAREVMALHMRDLVPVCIISKTYHELIHSGQRQLSPDIPLLHLGNYQEFIHEFHDYLTVEDYEKYISCGVSIENLEKGGMTCEIAKVGSVVSI